MTKSTEDKGAAPPATTNGQDGAVSPPPPAEPKAKKPVGVPDGERTKPRPVDESGRALDAWGLPLSGPARAAKLAELGKNDPHSHPHEWPQPATESQD